MSAFRRRIYRWITDSLLFVRPSSRVASSTPRLVLTLGALTIVLTGLVACGGVTRPAMTVDGSTYSRGDLKTDLETLSSIEGTQAATTGGKAPAVAPTKPKVFGATITAQALTNQLYSRIIHADFVSKKLSLAKAVDQKAASDAASNYGGAAVFDKLPQKFRDSAVRRQMEIGALRTHAVGGLDPKAYYDAHQADFAQTCISHLLVDSEAKAVAARTRIEKGEDFGAVAKDVSSDTGSKVQGGALGCGSVTQYVKEFAVAATALKVNELSQPVHTQFGFHILKVTKREAPKFDKNQQAIVQTKLDEVANAKLSTELSARLKSAKVTVDPAFGTYVADGGRGLPEIKAPGPQAPATVAAAPVAH